MNSPGTKNTEGDKESVPLGSDFVDHRHWVVRARDAMKEAQYWEAEPKAEIFR